MYIKMNKENVCQEGRDEKDEKQMAVCIARNGDASFWDPKSLGDQFNQRLVCFAVMSAGSQKGNVATIRLLFKAR